MTGNGQGYTPSAVVEGLDSLMLRIRSMIADAVEHRRWNGEVRDNGHKALESLIRSQSLIRTLHRHVADMLYASGLVAADRIQFERKLPTPFDGKDEDVVVIPHGFERTLGAEVIAIGLRSQLVSGGKNRKNNFSATRNDATDFHEEYPAQVVAHVQILALNEVDEKAAKSNELAWKRASQVARTISWYRKINGRHGVEAAHQHTERIALVVVDLAPSTPRIYRSVQELIVDGWVTQEEVDLYNISLDGLLLDEDFVLDVLSVHEQRFPYAKLLNASD